MSRKGCDINCPFWFQEACDPLHCPPEHTPHCSVCGEMMGWTVCSYCNGEGCVNCLGTGGEWECPDAWMTAHQEIYAFGSKVK